MPQGRPFQIEDVGAVVESHKSHQCVLGRAATGLGKAVELAMLTEIYVKRGRVMVLVDVKKLVKQLATTITWFTGTAPGIEMGDERAVNGAGVFSNHSDRVVVSTVQTQYSGEEGKERYRQFDPQEFSLLLLDECELFLAPTARSVVEWYLQNPRLRVFGCTATPMRTDGVSMANLFTALAFDRDIIWGIHEGWLVPARQAFVRVSIDFSTLKVRKGEDGEADYSDTDIAERLQNEQTLIELAKGIRHVAEDRRSIVVCPDVPSAKAVAHYLDAEHPGCAHAIWGELTDEQKDDLFDHHQRGEFQFLVSVMMLTKGYDDPQVRAVFNCRKTKSKRLYAQILGRGTRPLKGLLDGVPTPDERRSRIAMSAKPDTLMVNMVGVDASVRDVTLVDILGTADDPAVVERAKELVEDGATVEEAVEQAEKDVAEEQRMAREEAADAAKALDDEEQRQLRRQIDIRAEIEVEYSDDLTGGAAVSENTSRIPIGQLNILRKAKVEDSVINRLSPESASQLTREIVKRWKLGLCSYRQAKVLNRAGYSKAELSTMTRGDATAAIEAAKANNWRRPVEALA